MKAKALVLAAGAGTRMKSSIPKVAHNMLSKPIVRWVVDAARDAGCNDVHAIVGKGKEVVEPLLDDCTISYQNEQLGSGHAVMCAADKFEGFDGCVVLLNGDIPLIRSKTIKDLIERHEKSGAACTILTMFPDDATGYGRIVRDKNNTENVLEIVEHKDCSAEQLEIAECNPGIYCFDAKSLLERLDRITCENVQHEYYITDMLGIMVDDGLKVTGFKCEDCTECLGINDRSQLAVATQVMQYRINEHWMAEGVTMLDPSTVWIGPDVELAQDIEILPSTMLWGTTTIGEGCVVGPNTRLFDVRVGKNCTLDETVATESVLENGVNCGPRCYLRAGSYLMNNSKAGTSVEIKKSTIGEGSKVPHLSYVGDTIIGNNCNLGAGTITCNYDGKSKHQTRIGDNAFIGSSTMLIAPVTVGSGATVGALSAIAHDVPADSLALERSEQKHIPEWSKKKRQM